jgi:SAM-dependent methyltransferase
MVAFPPEGPAVSSPPDWDERFAEPGYAYGTEPNDFLREVAERIPRGPVLCLGEGEGRNATFLAGLGFEVTALDASRVGLAKAEALARERGVRLRTECADVTKYTLAPGAWSGIVSLWLHLPTAARAALHRTCVAGLAAGGAFVLEAYTPLQLELGTGGPREADRLATLAGLREELDGLDLEIGRELDREIHEGRYHEGRGAVVQVLGRKP